MSLTLITFRTLTIGLGHYMTEVWILMWLSLPFWTQKIFHLGFPPQNTDIFCIISLMEKVVLEFLILAVMLSLLGNCFSFIDSNSFTPCHPPWPRLPWPDCKEGSSAPGSAGVSRWQQQSTVGTQSCKISDRKQTGSQEAGILNIILFFLFIAFFFFVPWHLSGSDFFFRSPTYSISITHEGFSFYFLLHFDTWVVDRSLVHAPFKT